MSEEISQNHTGPFTRASMLLRKRKLTADEANELTELFENMASANIIAQFGSKLDALNATMKAQLEAVNNKLDTQLGAVNNKLDTQLGAVNNKLDTQMDAVNTQLAAQSTKYNVLIWAIGFATVILSAVMVFT